MIAFEMLGDSAISLWRNILGPTDPAVARREAPNSIRAKFGKSELKFKEQPKLYSEVISIVL